MDKQIIEFIKGRLDNLHGRFFEFRNLISDTNYYRIFFKEGHTIHIFTLILNSDESKKDWYESVFFDSSMDDDDKQQVMKEHNLNDEIKKYFPQKFEIGGHEWLLRWS